MPKLHILTACYDVLEDDEHNPSLISVFTGLDAANIAGEKIPPNALLPKDWKVFTMWIADEGEIGKEFTQKLTVVAPNGIEFGNSETQFKITARSHTIKLRVNGIPIGVEGNIVMKVWLKSGTKTITPIHTSEISIRHIKGIFSEDQKAG